MFDKIIGFIGAGNMGSAMIGGILNASLVTTGQVIASAHSKETLDAIHSRFSIETTLSNETVAERSDILFLAVKPNKFDEVIPQIAPHVKSSCIIGEAMSALCVNAHVTEAELSEVQAIFNSFGKAEVVPESLIDAVVGVSGSSPAYVYLFIEAMADAAVADGMPRAQAYKFAAQSVYGAAKMVLETGRHPGELKDAVCSPGGTTIEAVAALERGGLRDTVITAQRACSKKSHDMSTAK